MQLGCAQPCTTFYEHLEKSEHVICSECCLCCCQFLRLVTSAIFHNQLRAIVIAGGAAITGAGTGCWIFARHLGSRAQSATMAARVVFACFAALVDTTKRDRSFEKGARRLILKQSPGVLFLSDLQQPFQIQYWHCNLWWDSGSDALLLVAII